MGDLAGDGNGLWQVPGFIFVGPLALANFGAEYEGENLRYELENNRWDADA